MTEFEKYKERIIKNILDGVQGHIITEVWMCYDGGYIAFAYMDKVPNKNGILKNKLCNYNVRVSTTEIESKLEENGVSFDDWVFFLGSIVDEANFDKSEIMTANSFGEYGILDCQYSTTMPYIVDCDDSIWLYDLENNEEFIKEVSILAKGASQRF